MTTGGAVDNGGVHGDAASAAVAAAGDDATRSRAAAAPPAVIAGIGDGSDQRCRVDCGWCTAGCCDGSRGYGCCCCGGGDAALREDCRVAGSATCFGSCFATCIAGVCGVLLVWSDRSGGGEVERMGRLAVVVGGVGHGVVALWVGGLRGSARRCRTVRLYRWACVPFFGSCGRRSCVCRARRSRHWVSTAASYVFKPFFRCRRGGDTRSVAGGGVGGVMSGGCHPSPAEGWLRRGSKGLPSPPPPLPSHRCGRRMGDVANVGPCRGNRATARTSPRPPPPPHWDPSRRSGVLPPPPRASVSVFSAAANRPPPPPTLRATPSPLHSHQ